jgi:DNA polymerase-3 subunit delta'
VSTFGKPADKNELPIAVVQELVAQLALKPAFGRYKVVILDDADDLNEESANSFLKTLEEPPPTTVLILLATSQETQLPTIQSRCQIIRFQPLSLREVADVLLGLSVTASAAVAGEWAADSEGSVAQALEWSRSEWREFTSRFSAGLFGRDLANPAFVDQVLTFIDEAGKESSAKRHRARQVLRWSARELLLALRSACVQSTGDDAADVLADMIERTLDAEYHVARMAGVPLAMETWLDDLMRLRQGNYVAAIR